MMGATARRRGDGQRVGPSDGGMDMEWPATALCGHRRVTSLARVARSAGRRAVATPEGSGVVGQAEPTTMQQAVGLPGIHPALRRKQAR